MSHVRRHSPASPPGSQGSEGMAAVDYRSSPLIETLLAQCPWHGAEKTVLSPRGAKGAIASRCLLHRRALGGLWSTLPAPCAPPQEAPSLGSDSAGSQILLLLCVLVSM